MCGGGKGGSGEGNDKATAYYPDDDGDILADYRAIVFEKQNPSPVQVFIAAGRFILIAAWQPR